jgi:hypothetical protein
MKAASLSWIVRAVTLSSGRQFGSHPVMRRAFIIAIGLPLLAWQAGAEPPPTTPPGMATYQLVLLRTGPSPKVPPGEAKAMQQAHLEGLVKLNHGGGSIGSLGRSWTIQIGADLLTTASTKSRKPKNWPPVIRPSRRGDWSWTPGHG